MRGLDKITEKYFSKYKEKPVKIKPYDPKQKTIADLYIGKLNSLLIEYKPQLMVRGSTAFKILGKGEVEIGVYPKKNDWENVLLILTKKFGGAENLENNYARFNDFYGDTEVEIIVLKDHEAKVDIKLHEFLLKHPKILKEYGQIKQRYCYSKREYMIQKNKFFSEIINNIPEDY